MPVVAVVAALALAAGPSKPTPHSAWRSHARESGFVETGRLDELDTFCAFLETKQQGCETFGASPEGRPLRAAVLSSLPPSQRNSEAFRSRPVVFLIGGIHAGEIDGKDALFEILTELSAPPPLAARGSALAGVLDVVTVVAVPVYNVDGHEHFGENHRPNQRGPKQMGWRVTSQNLNLNRDWAKADAPETVAMLQLINRYDPVVTMDLHVTDGAQFRHDIAVLTEPWRDDGSDGALLPAAKALSDTLVDGLKKTGHKPLDFYPSFERDDEPDSGFSRGVTPARLTHGYVARRGRIGVLVETHSWQPYKARVKATIDVVTALLRDAVKSAPRWRQAADDADAAGTALVGKRVDVAFDSDPKSTMTIDFLGYAYTRAPSSVSGALMTRYDEKKPAIWKIPLIDDVVASVTVSAPAAYAVEPGFADVVEARLLAHGVVSHRLKAAVDVDGEAYRADSVTFRGPYEGRQTAKLSGSWRPRRETLPAGTLIVPVAQPRGRLVVELFEVGAPESLAGWGFFNARLEQKEYMEAYVAEDVARAMLTDPAVAAAFDDALKDPAFAASPEARLDFFYRRHPAFDERFNLLPVRRLKHAPYIRPGRHQAR